MYAILFDTAAASQGLLPLTFTRPVADLRVGILTIREKWERLLPGVEGWRFRASSAGVQAVCDEAEAPLPEGADTLWLNGAALPTARLAAMAGQLPEGAALTLPDGTLLAYRGDSLPADASELAVRVVCTEQPQMLASPTDIFTLNGPAIEADYGLLTAGRASEPLHPTVTVIGPADRVFLEPGATALACTINTTAGPVYLGRGAEVMEGSNLRGPVAVCDNAHVNLATRLWPATTIGPWCKVGGEINNVVFHSYSNKAHDGFLGNAVIGQWCNLGADTVASNLKNDYSPVKLWSYAAGGFRQTALQFCGLIMGDHSKAGINTMFNTATVVGVGCNIFGAGFPRTFLPSFTFGGTQITRRQPLEAMLEGARRMMGRRHKELTPAQEALLTALYDDTPSR